jgi:hypothetical protein
MIARNHIRAARYRALALTETDQSTACSALSGIICAWCTARTTRLAPRLPETGDEPG